MELVSELRERLHKAEMAMYNSVYPEEFKDILPQTFFYGDRDWTWEEMLDRYPEQIPILIEKCYLTFNDTTRDFKAYAHEMSKMRINHYCPFGESWKEFVKKEFVKNTSYNESNYGDNYSKHEVM